MFKHISIFILIIILFNCGKNKIVNSEDEANRQQQTASMALLEVSRTVSNQTADTLIIPAGAVWIGYILWKYDGNSSYPGRYGTWDVTPNIYNDTLLIQFNSSVSFEYKTYFIK